MKVNKANRQINWQTRTLSALLSAFLGILVTFDSVQASENPWAHWAPDNQEHCYKGPCGDLDMIFRLWNDEDPIRSEPRNAISRWYNWHKNNKTIKWEVGEVAQNMTEELYEEIDSFYGSFKGKVGMTPSPVLRENRYWIREEDQKVLEEMMETAVQRVVAMVCADLESQEDREDCENLIRLVTKDSRYRHKKVCSEYAEEADEEACEEAALLVKHIKRFLEKVKVLKDRKSRRSTSKKTQDALGGGSDNN